jgi:hypothetical protein
MAGDICNTNAYEADDKATHATVRAMFEEQIAWAVDERPDFLIAETIDWCGESETHFRVRRPGPVVTAEYAPQTIGLRANALNYRRIVGVANPGPFAPRCGIRARLTGCRFRRQWRFCAVAPILEPALSTERLKAGRQDIVLPHMIQGLSG